MLSNYDPFFMGHNYAEYSGFLKYTLDFSKSVDNCVEEVKKMVLRAVLEAVDLCYEKN